MAALQSGHSHVCSTARSSKQRKVCYYLSLSRADCGFTAFVHGGSWSFPRLASSQPPSSLPVSSLILFQLSVLAHSVCNSFRDVRLVQFQYTLYWRGGGGNGAFQPVITTHLRMPGTVDPCEACNSRVCATTLAHSL